MTIYSPPFSRINVSGRLQTAFVFLVLATLLWSPGKQAAAQARDDALSQREIDDLRDAAFVPLDRLKVFEQILDDRQKQIDTLLARRHGHTDLAGDLHDLLDQFGGIVDELNDNLDEWSRQHRDVRKGLPRLIASSDRWSTTLRSPPDDEAYSVVRRIALDNTKDARELAERLQTDLDTFFKAHPDAAKEELRRNGNPHAVHNSESPQ